MYTTIGAIIFMLGIVSADSECLLIPAGLLIVGAALYRIGERRGE